MSFRRRITPALWLVMAPMLVAASSCSDTGPRELTTPIFDARAPFLELSSAGGSSSTGASDSAKGASDFEKAIAASMAQGAKEDPEDVPDDAISSAAVQIQTVTLPGGLASSIPLDFDTWQWRSENGKTIITHRAPGATSPDAMIYAERFGALVRIYPSQEMARFRRFADPSFIPLTEILNSPQQVDAEQLRALGIDPAQLLEPGGLAPEDMKRVLDALDDAKQNGQEAPKPAPTLHYESSRSTFSGWTWFGQNAADVTLRLGRTEGRWSAPDSSGEGAPSSAWMLLGSADRSAGLGMHMAIICKQSPQCPVAEELSAFLAEMTPATE